MPLDSTHRFSDRVKDYIRYRPSYPAAVIDAMREGFGFSPGDVVVDAGCGTGIFSELLLKHGNRVIGVEPNEAMRGAAAHLLAHYRHFTTRAGRGEETGLADACCDVVVAAQAFHWFDAPAAAREFRRILRPGGHAALIWNLRRTDGTPFLRDYEAFLHEHGTDYAAVAERYAEPDSLAALFGPGGGRSATFDYGQDFDLEGLTGRTLSASYIPGVEHPRHASMLAALEALFRRHAVDGRVRFDYDTLLIWGQPAAR